jgi:hypothetical protein
MSARVDYLSGAFNWKVSRSVGSPGFSNIIISLCRRRSSVTQDVIECVYQATFLQTTFG